MNKVNHIGYIVKDVDKAMELFNKSFGVQNWKVIELTPPNIYDATYYGENVEHSFKAAKTTIDDLSIELIMPLSGKSVYSKFLEERGEGIHHIAKIYTEEEEFKLAVDKYVKHGGKIIQSGRCKLENGGESHYYYIEKDALVLEVLFRK
ncbi:MAG: VOC family protein [Bacteroidales bacterium]|jgi:catechol 2,3-dioxygenase-like lactoylglutathione lyase family enzyme|nr:VOC family protein [Actinomycetota bacterium]MDX9797327.1 VOC family protein [Bacteroidales bacterium]